MRFATAALLVACNTSGGDAPDAAGSGDAADIDANNAPTSQLTVVTINLRCLLDDWPARLSVLADGLAATGADVIGVQEVCSEAGGHDGLEELIAALAVRGFVDTVAVRTSTHRSWDRYDEGLAILSRHGVASQSITTLPAGALPRKLLAARVELRGRAIVVATTHLDHLGADARAAQATVVANELAAASSGDVPIVLVGDFNEAPAGRVAATLASAGLRDVWSELRGGDDGFTFPATVPNTRIDYIWQRGLTSIEIDRILDIAVGGTHASDHVGLRAVMR